MRGRADKQIKGLVPSHRAGLYKIGALAAGRGRRGDYGKLRTAVKGVFSSGKIKCIMDKKDNYWG